jgi:choline-glycine betaine transporter
MFYSKEKKKFLTISTCLYFLSSWNTLLDGISVLSPYQCCKLVNLLQLYLVQHQCRKLLLSFISSAFLNISSYVKIPLLVI